MSDSYCKGCRDAEAGCERCNPAREERARQQKLAAAERAVLDACEDVPLESWLELRDGADPSRPEEVALAKAELARRSLK